MAEFSGKPIIEWGDCIVGRQISQSPPLIERGGKRVVEIIFILSPVTIKRLLAISQRWHPKNCVDKIGNPSPDSGLFKSRYPAEMVLTPIYIKHENGEDDQKVRVLCGINREESDLTALQHRLLSRIEDLEKEQSTLYGSLAAKDYELGQARADVITYMAHNADLNNLMNAGKHYNKPEDDDGQKKKTEMGG